MLNLTSGQRITLDASATSLRLQCTVVTPATPLNFSCFALDKDAKLADERHLVFYNQLALPGNAVRLAQRGGVPTFNVELEKLPASIHKLVFVASVDPATALMPLATCQFKLSSSKADLARLDFAVQNFSAEKAVLVAEVYRRDGWRLAALAQGFSGGLEAVLKHFGGEPAQPSASNQPPPPIPVVSPPVPNSSPPTPTPSSVPPPITDPNACVRCQRKPGFWELLRNFNNTTGRCSQCEKEVQSALEQFRRDFLAASATGILHDDQWQAMWSRLDLGRQKISYDTALEYIWTDRLQFVERLVTVAAADGTITPDAEKYIDQMLVCLSIPAHAQQPIKQRIEYLKVIARIREGHLPVINASHHLDAGELCHMEMAATYHKVNTRSTTTLHGKLLATSKKLLFLSPKGGWTIQYKNIMRIEESPPAIYLELTTKSGNGNYTVADPLLTEAVLSTLTRMAKRQLLIPRSESMSRHIPQDVRNAVWQRDGGQCVECGAKSYLEFDHTISYSQGGASTVGNVQLLCRKCNLAKGARI